jgi:hypothetical protein
VCRKFETKRRRLVLSFKHHREVCALPPAEADALLNWCEETIAEIGLGFWRSLFEFALISTSLQIGYVAIPAFRTLFNLPRRVRLQRRQARAESMASTASMRRH